MLFCVTLGGQERRQERKHRKASEVGCTSGRVCVLSVISTSPMDQSSIS